ncbi:MAG: penicillin-binding protein activator [Pseudomonadota bacterium]
MKWLYKPVGLLLIIVTMNACQSTPSNQTYRESRSDADALLRNAANASLSNRVRLTLEAVQEFLNQDDLQRAASTLASLSDLPIPEAFSDAYARSNAQVLSRQGRGYEAQEFLAGVSRWQGSDFLLLGQLCEATSQHQCAADALIQASLSLGFNHPDVPEDVNDRIWSQLGLASTAPQAFVHRYHHAWWRLQQEQRSAGSIVAQQKIWQTFQRRNPSHPATIRPPRVLLSLMTYQAPVVGVFLPLSGNLGQLGTAVRDGFAAAYLGDATQTKVTFYDTNNTDLGQLWERALQDGIEVAVGPLLKQNAERFAQITQYSNIPTLLLNYTQETLDAPHLFQFGIAIEDEANALAQQVLMDGHARILVVHSRERWAERARTTFEDQWPYHIAHAGFNDAKNVTQAVGTAMQVAASHERRRELANILGEELEFLARARKDLDAVVAFTNQVESRALLPALKFHFADDLPIYATSQATRGEAKEDLSGFKLTEMPLFAEPTQGQQVLTQAFDLRQSSQADLLALGFDAFRLATWLPMLADNRQLTLPGATGYLWISEGGRVSRDLPLVLVASDGALVSPE